ncbi:MAG: histidine kinase, partial [Bdellovibrio sp.]|nr:histidine kinase [Bdellovibrio sp.]
MLKRSLLFVLSLSAHLICFAANAQTPIALAQDESSKNITFFLRSGTSAHGVQDPRLVQFKDLHESELKLSYSDQDLWIQFRLKNNSEFPLQKVLLLDSPLSGKLTLIKESSPPAHSGPGYPLSERAYPSRLGAFAISLEPHEDALFYLKRSSHHALNAHVMIATPQEVEKMEGTAKAIFFFYLGGILSLVIYNFMLGLFTTQKDHLIYSLFAASFGTTAMVLHGVFDTYLWPQANFVFSNYLMLFSSLSLFSASVFVGRFLNIKKDFALGYWGLRVYCGLSLVTMGVSFFAPHFPSLYIFGYWID